MWRRAVPGVCELMTSPLPWTNFVAFLVLAVMGIVKKPLPLPTESHAGKLSFLPRALQGWRLVWHLFTASLQCPVDVFLHISCG